MGNYLIPANSKKSMMIFGLFYPFDLILFSTGLGATLLLLVILPVAEMVYSIIAITPVLITAFLVFPIPNYHNVLTVIINAITFNEKIKFAKRCNTEFIDRIKKAFL